MSKAVEQDAADGGARRGPRDREQWFRGDGGREVDGVAGDGVERRVGREVQDRVFGQAEWGR